MDIPQKIPAASWEQGDGERRGKRCLSSDKKEPLKIDWKFGERRRVNFSKPKIIPKRQVLVSVVWVGEVCLNIPPDFWSIAPNDISRTQNRRTEREEVNMAEK